MTPEEFAAVYPLVLRRIQQTIAAHQGSAKTVASRGFNRLPLYFSQELLDDTKVVAVTRVPVPPLSSMGLQRFRDFEQGDWDGITYLDTWFSGPESFLKLYADGLERFGYQDSPLEKMAYNAQAEFSRSKQPFDAQALVLRELRKLSAL